MFYTHGLRYYIWCHISSDTVGILTYFLHDFSSDSYKNSGSCIDALVISELVLFLETINSMS
jgi:hypothetical protein